MKNIFQKPRFGLILALTCLLLPQCNTKPITDDSTSERNKVAFCAPCDIDQNSLLIIESSPTPIYLDIGNRQTFLDKFPTQIAILEGESISFKAHRQTVFHIREIQPRQDFDAQPVNISNRARLKSK